MAKPPSTAGFAALSVDDRPTGDDAPENARSASAATADAGFRCGRLSCVALVLLVAGLATATTVLVVLYKRALHPSVAVPSPMSASLQARVSSFIDWNADPCDDFYQFACGGWSFQPSAAEPALYATLGEMENRTVHQQLDVLKESFPFVGTFLRGCLDASDQERHGSAALRPWFDLIDTATSENEFFRVLGVIHRHGVHPLESDVESDFLHTFFTPLVTLETRQYQLTLLPVGWSALDLFTAPDVAALFEELVVSGLLPASGDPSPLPPAQLAARVYAFEVNMTGTLLDETNLDSGDWTLNEVVRQTGFPVRFYLAGLGDASISGGAAGGAAHISRVMLASPATFRTLRSMVREAFALGEQARWPPQVLRGYLKFRVVAAMLRFLPARFTDRLPAWPKLSAAAGAGQRTSAMHTRRGAFSKLWAPQGAFAPSASGTPTRQQLCNRLAVSEFRNLLEHQWVAEHWPPENKAAGQRLVERMHAELGNRIREVSWLDAATRAVALKKWAAMTRNVGYDSHWDEWVDIVMRGHVFADVLAVRAFNSLRELAVVLQPLDRHSFPRIDVPAEFGILMANAFYSTAANSINLPAGVLLEPVFSASMPEMLNTAMCGFVVGHELVHGFDGLGLRFNGSGQFGEWWSDEALMQFRSRSTCLAKQYSKYQVHGRNVSGLATASENIADLGGMNLAYSAYQRLKMDAQPRLFERLPNAQLFFTYAAQLWCHKALPEVEDRSLRVSSHAPPRFRVNGVVSNMPSFASTFQCSASSAMGRSLTTRCELW